MTRARRPGPVPKKHLLYFGSGGETRLVRSFAEGLLAAVSCPRPPGSRYNTPAFTLLRKADDYAAMGGVDFAIGAPFSPLPGRSYWFWPEGMGPDGRRVDAHVHQMRYADPLAAVAASIRMHPAAATDAGPLGGGEGGAEWSVFCFAQRSPDLSAAAYRFSGRVRAWFDDVDEGLAPGAARAWFLAGVAALPSPPPIRHISDEWL